MILQDFSQGIGRREGGEADKKEKGRKTGEGGRDNQEAKKWEKSREWNKDWKVFGVEKEEGEGK